MRVSPSLPRRTKNAIIQDGNRKARCYNANSRLEPLLAVTPVRGVQEAVGRPIPNFPTSCGAIDTLGESACRRAAAGASRRRGAAADGGRRTVESRALQLAQCIGVDERAWAHVPERERRAHLLQVLRREVGVA